MTTSVFIGFGRVLAAIVGLASMLAGLMFVVAGVGMVSDALTGPK